MKCSSVLLFSLSLFFFKQALADEGNEPKNCTEGNFSVPPSQLPGPLVGFGTLVIPKNTVQAMLTTDAYINKNSYFTDVIPGVLYGIRDDLSLFINVPFTPRYKDHDQHSSGLEDFYAQLEYAYYSETGTCYSQQATVLANASFPTGSSHKSPPTGFGSMSYFIGATYSYLDTKWFCFTEYGALLTTSHHGTKFGNAYLYEFGFGRLFANPKGWIFDWMIEIDGAFYEKDKFHGVTNPNSGGNIIYVTPSLWASNDHWFLQLGLGYAVYQHLFGHQNRNEYLLQFSTGYTF